LSTTARIKEEGNNALRLPCAVICTVSDQRSIGTAMMSPTLHLYLIEPERNCYRYYELSLQPGLFQEWSLSRSWGRIGAKGRDKIVWFASREQAERFYERKRREKLRRGYQSTLFPIAPYCPSTAPHRQETAREVLPHPRRPTPPRAFEGQQEMFSLYPASPLS
jgi:predicted DNA-binding WGR domain protein